MGLQQHTVPYCSCDEVQHVSAMMRCGTCKAENCNLAQRHEPGRDTLPAQLQDDCYACSGGVFMAV